MALPQAFIDLGEAHRSADNAFVNIIGVVVDIMQTTQTRTGEHMFTFRLLDQKLSYSVIGSEGLKVRFFSKDKDVLPRVRTLGDVVLLRQIKMTTFDSQRVALSNYSTGVLVFPSEAIPSLNFSISFQGTQRLESIGIPQEVNKLNLAEQHYVMMLKQTMSSHIERCQEKDRSAIEQQATRRLEAPEVPPAKRQKMSNSFGPKFRCIGDLQPKTFVDLCGTVVKNIAAAGYGGNDLYITDYTSNELMRYYPPPEEEDDPMRDGDTFGYAGPPRKAWPGPYEWNVLKVNLKPPHAAFANNTLKEGDLVLLRNVKVRMTDIAKLEGDMWPDDKNPERIKIQKLLNPDIPEIHALLQRKEKYWSARDKKGGKKLADEPKLSKKEKKRLKRLEQEQKQKAGNAEGLTKGFQLVKDSIKDKNPHIRCSHEEVAITTVTEVLDTKDNKHTMVLPDGGSCVLPFMNARYRIKVRVVDYEPKILEEFAHPLDPGGDDSVDSIAWQYNNTPKYEWHFSLQLEDASKPTPKPEERPARVWAQVHHQAAQFLLGNEVGDPDDLKEDRQLLNKLREKLFVLWGNLEERGTKDLSNLPFECCIQEYGLETAAGKAADAFGCKRMYSMFGATIL